jgi:TonB family protein
VRKICFALSAIAHALVIALLARTSFPIKIKILPVTSTIIDISLPEMEAVPYPRLSAPAFAIRGKNGRATAQFPGSGSGNGSAPSPQAGQPWAGGTQISAFPYPAAGRLKLKSASASTFSLVLPVPGPPATAAFASSAGTGKWLHPDEYAAGTYPGGIQFEPGAAPGGGRHVRIPFSIQNKEVTLWTQNILARIERNWIIPTMAKVGQTGQVQITLTVDHSGNSLSLSVGKSSSQELLDQAALNAMKASLPFPPLPEDISPPSFVFYFIFTYNV